MDQLWVGEYRGFSSQEEEKKNVFLFDKTERSKDTGNHFIGRKETLMEMSFHLEEKEKTNAVFFEREKHILTKISILLFQVDLYEEHCWRTGTKLFLGGGFDHFQMDNLK